MSKGGLLREIVELRKEVIINQFDKADLFGSGDTSKRTDFTKGLFNIC